MYVVCVTIWVEPENVEEFLRATEANHVGTRGEEGNLRFDVCRATDDPTRFFLYEVYRDEAAFHEHHQSAHYLQWKETVADWMAQPRQGARYESLLPADDSF